MLTFMDYIQQSFDTQSTWNRDNSYSTLTLTAQSLLDFPTPRGLRLHISSLPSPNLATSYTLSTTGLVDGSISYLYSSLPLRDFIQGYRHLASPRAPDAPWHWEHWHGGKRIDARDVLLHGRVFLPGNRLEALYLRRRKPTQVVKIEAVSDKNLPNGGTVLGTVKNDHGKYSTEFLYSTDSALLGARGLYNFGPDPRKTDITPENPTPESQAGLFSLGSELYYGVLNKSFGLSTGLRFTTLPSHTGFPYTMTLTLNPLMGNLSSTYAVKAGRNLALCSRFDFNFYSYESRVLVGLELWRMRARPDVEWAKRKLREAGWAGKEKAVEDIAGIPKRSEIREESAEDVTGVLKARVDQDWRIGLVWEGRFKELLFSVGANVDLKRREQIFRGLGLEVQYSS